MTRALRLGAAHPPITAPGIGTIYYGSPPIVRWLVWVPWLQAAGGLSSQNQAMIGGAPTVWNVAAIADFDGDGRDDILLRHDDGTLARWTTDGVIVSE